MTSKELLALAGKLGIGASSPSASIEDAQADRIRRRADADGLRREVPSDAPKADKAAKATKATKASVPVSAPATLSPTFPPPTRVASTPAAPPTHRVAAPTAAHEVHLSKQRRSRRGVGHRSAEAHTGSPPSRAISRGAAQAHALS